MHFKTIIWRTGQATRQVGGEGYWGSYWGSPKSGYCDEWRNEKSRNSARFAVKAR